MLQTIWRPTGTLKSHQAYLPALQDPNVNKFPSADSSRSCVSETVCSLCVCWKHVVFFDDLRPLGRREAFLHEKPGRAERHLHQHEAEEESTRLRLHGGRRWRARRVSADQKSGAGRACSCGWKDGNRCSTTAVPTGGTVFFQNHLQCRSSMYFPLIVLLAKRVLSIFSHVVALMSTMVSVYTTIRLLKCFLTDLKPFFSAFRSSPSPQSCLRQWRTHEKNCAFFKFPKTLRVTLSSRAGAPRGSLDMMFAKQKPFILTHQSLLASLEML